MSNLSELLPAGGAAKEFEAVASGTLANGQTVVLNSDGTVSAVASQTFAQTVGSPVTFHSSTVAYTSTVFDPVNNKIVIFYTGTSNYGTAIIGTVSGTSISFGTPVVYASSSTFGTNATYMSGTGKIAIAYNQNSLKTIIGTVSGTTISFGTPYNLGYSASVFACAYNEYTNALVVSFRNPSVSNYGQAIAGVVSGTSFSSFGSATTFNSANTQQISMIYDPFREVAVVAYKDSGGSQSIETVVFFPYADNPTYVQKSGNWNLNFTNAAMTPGMAYDSRDNKIIVVGDKYNEIYITRFSVDANQYNITIDNASGVTTSQYGQGQLSCVYDSNAEKAVILYRTTANPSLMKALVATFPVGTANPTFGSVISIDTVKSAWNSAAFDSSQNEVVVAYSDETLGSKLGLATVFQNASSSTNVADFIGITQEAIADTATGLVTPQGGVALTTLPYEFAFGSATAFDTANYTDYLATVYDTNAQKVVHFYPDFNNSGYGTAIVGTVSGASISYGTPVVFESANSAFIAATYDSASNKVVVAYNDAGNSDYGTAAVGTVSGTSISFGTPVVFETSRPAYTTATFDSSNNKVVIAYQDNLNSNYGTIVVGTVSGTSISFGTPSIFNSATTYYMALTFDSNANKVVLGYRDGSNGNAGTAVVGTVSGTSISFGSASVFQSGSSNWTAATFDSNSNKVLFAYNNSTAGKVAVGTVSGTSISFGTPVTFDVGNSNQFSTAFDSNLNQVMIVYRDQSNSTYGTVVNGTISGTTVTFGDNTVFAAVTVNAPQVVFDSSANKPVVVYIDTAATGSGTSLTAALTNELVIGSDYYVQDDGTLSTTVSSVPAGRALSTTSILLEG